jgi:hypothetical protein
MKTLALSSLILEPLTQKVSAPQINRGKALHKADPYFADNSAWRAFQDGMKVLYRYADRSDADTSVIAKANLRLLHHTLLADPSYRERLKTAGQELPVNGLPVISNLLNIQGLCADLITLQAGCDTQTAARKQVSRMYMVISGKVVTNCAMALPGRNNQPVQHRPIQRKSWWERLRHTSKDNEYSKGDVILFAQEKHGEKMLGALENHCVLLGISLSVTQHESNQFWSDNIPRPTLQQSTL